MSSEAELLYLALVGRGVVLEADEGRLHVRAPPGALDPQLRSRLRALKPGLLALLAARAESAPLTGPQRQLWFVERVTGSAGLELILRLRLRGELDRPALEAAMAALIERHQALRTRFELRAGTPVQVVVREPPSCWSSEATDPEAGRPLVAALERLGPREHQLTLRVHHIVCDGWSMAVLLEDLGRLYSAGGQPLEPLTLEPRDVARELAAREAQPSFEARLASWATALAGVSAIALPVDRERPPRPSARGGHLARVVDARSWAAAKAFGRSHDATAFMVVAAAVIVVLSRWTGSRDLCLGTPFANRGRPELERVVAMLVDTLLLRVELDDGALDFAAVLERVREAALASLAHTDIPLDRLVARLHASSGRRELAPGQATLPNVMLNFAGFERPRPRFAGLECELEASMPGARFELTIYAYPRGGALELEAAFRSELFETETIAALLEQIAAVLQRGPSWVGGWRTIPLAERSGRTPALAPSTLEVPARERLFEWLDAAPVDQVAVVEATGEIRYGQLRERVARLAARIEHALADAGAGERRVAILARRSREPIVALLATLRARATFVILDAAHPPAHLAALVGVARPQAWIAAADEPPAALARALAGVPRVGAEGPVEAATSHERALRDVPAYLAFTSGTSGRPRAVVGALEPVVHFLGWYRDALAITARDRFAWLSGLGHDPTLRDLLGALCAGARVCVPPREPARMGAELGAWLAAGAATIIHITPALARMLAATSPGPLPTLRRVCFGGDRLRGSEVASWRRLAPNAELLNFYGATETPQAVAVHRITDADAARPLVPIGRGIEGVELELRTPAGPAAVGEIGEIVVVTEHLARGYFDELELTRARFDGPRYATGDLGRRRPDGSVICIGRADGQLSIRGVRVEPSHIEGAIEAALATRLGSASSTARAAVVARPGPDGELELVAWLTGVDAPMIAALRDALTDQLPRAMLPTRWALIDALPLTANAKLDRRALAARELEASAPAEAYEAPSTALEDALATIWAELLERPRVGRRDDFFAIGGHSLLAVSVATQVHERLGLELPVLALFEHPTLAACAAAIEQRRVDDTPALEPGPREHPAPASFAQQRIWLVHELDREGGAPQLCITHTLELAEALELEALDRALVELETRHLVLRTSFALTDEGLVQRVGPPRATILERGPPPAEPARFDLERGPVWRARTWTSQDGHARLELQLHHICGEAGSMRILADELVELLLAAREHRRARLATPARIQYLDFAAWQRRVAAGEGPRRSLAAWVERLRGIEALELPLARARPPRQRYRGVWTERSLEPALARGLERRAAAESTTVFATVLTALVAVLARWCGTTDLAIGSPVGLRPHPATRALVGPFLELVCLRVDASGDPSLAALLGRARACVREAFSMSDVPFEHVVEALYAERGTARELGRTPVFQVLLNMVDIEQTERSWARIGAQRVIEGEPVARYDLAVYALRRGEELRLAVVHDAALFVPAQIELLLEHLEAGLRTLVEQPTTRLSTLALRRPTPARASASTVATRGSAFEQLTALAAAQPNHIAVDTGVARTSYAELLSHARTIAATLASRPGPWARIGLLVDEDATMAAAMFGALAAGVAYVPLDPRLPVARLDELIHDALLDALLCSSARAELGRALAGARPLVSADALPPGALPFEATTELERLAYLLYTSGSTGRPKAVMQSQANLLHHARSYAAGLGLGPGDRVSLVSTHAFDAAVMDIYAALLSGATLCPFDLRGAALVDLAAAVRARGITVFHSTPTVLRHLAASFEGPPLTQVRWVVLGGEEARSDDALAVARCFGARARLINGLGPTECTLALQERLEPDAIAELEPGESLAVGAPVAGVTVALETALGQQPALFGVGELVLDSPHLALGYWQRPEATAAAFSHRDGRRRYRSGDLGRWLPGGRVGFVGRRGGFVKIRGQRVEPGELEAKLRGLAGVRAAAVDVRESDLIAFWVATNPDAPPSSAALREALSAALPAAMVPRALVRVDALPQTATGKIDRRALAQLPAPSPTTHVHGRPRSASEIAISSVWAAILGHEPADLDSDFFACGGDSLGAARLVRALADSLALDVSLAELFEGRSIAQLAARLDGAPSLGLAPPQARLRQLAAGEGTPWIVVLPPGQRPRVLEGLAARLGRPLWSLEPPSFGDRGPLPSPGAITAALAEALEHLDPPDSSFVLAGLSNGGLLAWPLGAALRERVQALVLLDSFPPALLAARPWPERGQHELLASFVQLLGVSAGEPSSLAHALELLASVEPRLDLDALTAMFEHYRIHGRRVWQVLSRLELDAGLAPILIEARAGNARQLAQRWRALVRELRVIEVPGDHLGMFEPPHVDALAEALRGCAPGQVDSEP